MNPQQPYGDPNLQPPPPFTDPRAPGPMFIEPPTSAMAIASFVLGIAGFFLIPVIGSILAVIFGHMARNEIKMQNGQVKGDGFALAGIIMGYAGIGMLVVFLIFLGLFAAFISAHNFNSSF